MTSPTNSNRDEKEHKATLPIYSNNLCTHTSSHPLGPDHRRLAGLGAYRRREWRVTEEGRRGGGGVGWGAETGGGGRNNRERGTASTEEEEEEEEERERERDGEERDTERQRQRERELIITLAF